jgi:hypothetical protein
LKRSSAQTYALVIGLALTALGIVGFLFCSSAFGKPGEVSDVFGVFAVNGWHNLLHLLSGLILLAAARSYGAARSNAIAFAALYGALAIWGFVIGTGESILGIVPVNAEDNVLHLVIALLGIGAGLSTGSVPKPSLAGTEPGGSFRELRL